MVFTFPDRLRAECYLRFLHFSGIPACLCEEGKDSPLPVLAVCPDHPSCVAPTALPSLLFSIGSLSLDEGRVLRCRDVRFSMTKTQTRIFRALILAYPETLAAEELLRFCFLPEKRPEVSSLRTHVCAVNRKWCEVFSSPLAVFRGGGYVLNEDFVF